MKNEVMFLQEILHPKPEAAETERRRFFCPSCNKHTVLWLLPSTEIKNLPIKCKRCGKENIINVTSIEKR